MRNVIIVIVKDVTEEGVIAIVTEIVTATDDDETAIGNVIATVNVTEIVIATGTVNVEIVIGKHWRLRGVRNVYFRGGYSRTSARSIRANESPITDLHIQGLDCAFIYMSDSNSNA